MLAIFRPQRSPGTRRSLPPADPAVAWPGPMVAHLLRVFHSGRSGGRIREEGARVGAGEENGISYPHLRVDGSSLGN